MDMYGKEHITDQSFDPTNLVQSDKFGISPSNTDLTIVYRANNKLRTASNILKRNLQTYLSEYRMINDSINIKDAYILNIGVNFDIIVTPNYNNNEVITNCITSLTSFFDINKWQINEPILYKDIFILLDKIQGVQTVKNVEIINLAVEALGYSQFSYDIKGATIDEVVYPSIDHMIFEVKYPTQDIKGRVVPL